MIIGQRMLLGKLLKIQMTNVRLLNFFVVFVFIAVRICWWFSCRMKVSEPLYQVKWRKSVLPMAPPVWWSIAYEVYMRIEHSTRWFVPICQKMHCRRRYSNVFSTVRFVDAATTPSVIRRYSPNAIFHWWKSNDNLDSKTFIAKHYAHFYHRSTIAYSSSFVCFLF